MIACRPTSWKAMFCAVCWAAAAIGTAAKTRSRIEGGPLQHLHPAHRTADDREHLVDAEVIEQHRLGTDHVGDGDDGKPEAPRLARLRAGFARSGRTHAAAEDVDAEHVVAIGVEDAAGADEIVPPAAPAGDRMRPGGVLVAGQRVTDDDGVRFRRVQPAVRLIGDGKVAERDAAVELQRPIAPELGRVAPAERRLRRQRKGWTPRAVSSTPSGSRFRPGSGCLLRNVSWRCQRLLCFPARRRIMSSRL